MSWICTQIEAREHYAVPRLLAKRNCLHSLYTDFWAGSMNKLYKRLPGPFPAMAGRFYPEMQKVRVASQNFNSLIWGLKKKHYSNIYDFYQARGQAFSTWTMSKLRSIDLKNCTHFFSYDTGFLEAADFCKKRGLKTILGQIDPGEIEQQIVQEEEKKWSEWSNSSLAVPYSYNDRRQQEWAIADTIVVNSVWSKNALIQQGVSKSKLKVIPLAYEPPFHSSLNQNPKNRNSPLNVLWLGSVILRKGIQYLIAAAKKLPEINFTIAGPIHINQKVVNSCPDNMIFTGKINRLYTEKLFKSHDVFILPTISDGFAITQLEAMSQGLPVIATTNCGDVVQHGKNGFIIPPFNSIAIIEILRQLLIEPEIIYTMKNNCINRANDFSLNKISKYYINL